MRDLAIGMSGPDVRALQGLNTRSEGIASPIAVDGVFGPETDQAVRAFQKRQQLDVDGVVGRETRLNFSSCAGYRHHFRPENQFGAEFDEPSEPEGPCHRRVLSRQAAVRSSSGSGVYAEDPHDSRRHEETNDGLGDSP